ncbi:ABC transporter permease [Hufsiella ginkgonis]|uniref:FtsX-like permease family protein n=1 Tax=Hufsiella ginkgonis TaxID=2695274 RepID=A0A7K1XSK7_9SPHI|nr:ABC transporter permease [Hufsiella ginkgonis]MXV13985.1 FtsX-like permease family protein [Hufsiella ginkgonis]
MAAAVMILLWVHNERSYDTFHSNSDQLYRVSYLAESGSGNTTWERTPFPLGETVKRQLPEIEQAATAYSNDYNPPVFKVNGEIFNGKGVAFVNQDWLKVFRYQFLEGSAASFFAHPQSLVLTRTAAEKYFGKGGALGKSLNIDSVEYQVRAIVADNPPNSSFRFQVLIPFAALTPAAADDMRAWGNHSCLTFVKLRKDASVHALERKISAIVKIEKDKQWKSKYVPEYTLLPLRAMHFETDVSSDMVERGDEKRVTLFTVFAVLLVIIACINYVNLVTAKASLRIKEVSIKKISGAGRTQIFGQFVIETGALSLISMLVTVLLVNACLPFFNNFTARELEFSVTSLTTWLILGGTWLVIVILASIYPALLLSSFRPVDVFRGHSIFSIRDAGLRKGLVVVQFTVSVVLIAGIVIMYRQQQFIRETDASYNRSQVFSIKLPTGLLVKMKRDPGSFESSQRRLWFRTFKQELAAQPGIGAVTFTQSPVLNNEAVFDEGLQWQNKPEDTEIPVTLQHIQPDYGAFFNMTLVSGRWLRDEPSDENSFLINETGHRRLALYGPVIGKKISINNIAGTVVGVVKDFHYTDFHQEIKPLLMAYNPNWYGIAYVKTRAGNTRAALAAAEKVFKQAVPAKPFEYEFLDESFDAMYRAEQKTWVLLNVFTGLILFISCLGIFGLSAHTAELRTREIGIRKVLGASVTGITALLTKDFVKLVVVAIVIASPVAWWIMNKWLQDFAYRVPVSWWMFALAGVAALTIAVLTVSFQSVKAARGNPVNSLRNE